ncbi:MAG: 4-hydroxy-3-methylbut-2-en-1-yl diphosphate synthase, partial [Neisseriaceae bacterium]|nr:4-hydroxy-3-methylbut-2-en-1-yl diphosphate synthase [Neisseriaceae bacterium]
ETPVAPVYVDGEKTVTLKGDKMVADFIDIVEEYVQSHYANNIDNKKTNKKVFDIKAES